MYLKEIEANGFKSFADKFKISLDDNITCIVGPNGSGKSNVVDAVRWVLGEQSVKSLRGDGSMSDVIFSGSKSRNPLNVASVSLTFDNSDHYLNVPYEEVAVKRRVYRTGENEYFLNGEKCRLKDITDLFLDSGIGRESFNIISQGEVQRILSNSPMDRRVILEEAAGVLKYKKRKEEAIRKLDRTHDNLSRASDILAELEVQVEPLREQSKKAKEYLDQKEKLEQIEVALIVYDVDIMNERYQNAKTKLEELNNEIVILRNGMSDTKIDSSKVTLMHLEEEIASLNKQLLDFTKQEERLNGEKKVLKERSNYKAEDSKVHEQIASLTELKMSLSSSLAVLEQELTLAKETLQNLMTGLNKEQVELNNLTEKKEQSERELSQKTREITMLEHQIDILTNSIENGDNLPTSVKQILSNPRLTGIYQVIGNLFTVDMKYARAIDIALGGSKQFLVVENEISAKNAISYLKENRLGRATFFPLSVIKPKGIDYETIEILKKEDGFIDVASSLITFDSKFRNILLNQLGNVVVVEDIDDANRISKKIKERYKIVTLDGEVIHVGGSISGGMYQNNRSMITDKLELEKLIRVKKENEEALEEITKALSNIEEEIKLQEEKMYEKRGEVFQNQEELKQKETVLDATKEKLETAEKDLSSFLAVSDSSLNKEEEKLMATYYEVVKEKELLEAKLKQKTKEKDELQQTILELEGKQRVSNTKLRNKENETKELEIEITKMDVKLDHYLNTLNEEYELSFEKAKNNYMLTLEPEDARSKVSLYRSNIKRLGMVNLASIDEFERVNTRYEFLSKQRDDLLEAKDTLLEIIDEMDGIMKEEFKTTFAAVNQEFKTVFKQLFRGGDAALKLTDPNNLLETGIEIVASPPGKKLTSISLLSGGEKTLTAISLLFAILNVRTVPFCLFDEVEAALDEANVDQFGKYLEHYKEKTQFLLITHKKKTMEYAHTLYGITMQESGVSKLVSVRFEDTKEDFQS